LIIKEAIDVSHYLTLEEFREFAIAYSIHRGLRVNKLSSSTIFFNKYRLFKDCKPSAISVIGEDKHDFKSFIENDCFG
jgi:hypothetical protein